jgi:5-hydroxyisourate hydrolase
MGHLTTHVLDTAAGRPAAGMALVLERLFGETGREHIVSAITNADGRIEVPLLAGDTLVPGIYELTFAVGAYFRRSGQALPEPAFLESVPVRFGIADPNGHYHVPLLVSPWSYSTYRGS